MEVTRSGVTENVGGAGAVSDAGHACSAPPDARREGMRLSRCHGGASGDERRDISGRVQLDVGAGGVQRGIRTQTPCRARTAAGACAAAPRALWKLLRAGTPATSRYKKRATVAKADYPRAGGTRHVIQVAVLCLPPPEI
ncbi:hypothetical protein B0H14DRAFT_2565259 [Mycena olivaceomarginata]|nr:hypothetical protein B0H14DRAFT_2565259 [Mycena olivaceomarginata]